MFLQSYIVSDYFYIVTMLSEASQMTTSCFYLCYHSHQLSSLIIITSHVVRNCLYSTISSCVDLSNVINVSFLIYFYCSVTNTYKVVDIIIINPNFIKKKFYFYLLCRWWIWGKGNQAQADSVSNSHSGSQVRTFQFTSVYLYLSPAKVHVHCHGQTPML